MSNRDDNAWKIPHLPSPPTLAKRMETEDYELAVFLDYLRIEMSNNRHPFAGEPPGQYTYSVRRPFYARFRETIDPILAAYGWRIHQVHIFEETAMACPYITLKPL